jgi:hypothetical protein
VGTVVTKNWDPLVSSFVLLSARIKKAGASGRSELG